MSLHFRVSCHVSLPHLNTLTIDEYPPSSILRIPSGASLSLGFDFSGEKSPLLDYLPEASANLRNLARITVINLHFDSEEKFVQLSRPSGSLHVFARWVDWETDSYTIDRRILHSLGQPILSTTQRLTISKYRHPNRAEDEEPPVFQTLSSTNNLRTLILTKCENLPFILALNPEENPSKPMLCPNLEEFVLYVKLRDQLHIECLISMVKNRASRGAKLLSITCCVTSCWVGVFKLRESTSRI